MKPVTISPAAMMLVLCLTAAMAVNEVPFRGCSNELVALSPCLPYLASPPNNRSSLAFPPCLVALCRFLSSFRFANLAASRFGIKLKGVMRCSDVTGENILQSDLIAIVGIITSTREHNRYDSSIHILSSFFMDCFGPANPSDSGNANPLSRSAENSPAAASTSTPPESVVSSSIPEDYSPEPVPNISTLKPADSSNYRSLPGISLFFTPICTYLLH
ncbi:PREDICTED: uncharacterized protein LOC104598719 [Nelumbo nucifera]|uniref:Uncharacterized protein LOC104598719 n=1 Tax=Nelumbo nucifera TaxID=4432 RepID=A0A1U8Q3Z0_NELNU|nr:PREDICTED: uncharacterized protein LOC104598719 [Nelumbo nucifera]